MFVRKTYVSGKPNHTWVGTADLLRPSKAQKPMLAILHLLLPCQLFTDSAHEIIFDKHNGSADLNHF